MILSLTPGTAAHEFACHSAACRPPTSGGTGGSTSGVRHGGTASQVRSGSAAAYVKSKDRRNAAEDRKAMNDILGAQAAARKETVRQQELRQVRLKEYQAAQRAKLDRVMGIKPERTVRVKAGKWSDWQGN